MLALGALALGWLHAFRYIGHLLLCAAAGVALVLHAVLFKQGLLVESLVGTWVLMGGVGFGLLVVGIWQQRLGVVRRSSSRSSLAKRARLTALVCASPRRSSPRR